MTEMNAGDNVRSKNPPQFSLHNFMQQALEITRESCFAADLMKISISKKKSFNFK